VNDLLIEFSGDHSGSANFSPCGKYRYQLTRKWDSTLPIAYWVMLNPSTADAFKNDHTITKVMGFSQQEGFGMAIILNLFAYRTSHPKVLFQAHRDGIDIIGPENNRFLGHAIKICHDFPDSRIIGAWGANGDFLGRDYKVLQTKFPDDVPLYLKMNVLGKNKNGSPSHPLRLAYACKLGSYFPS